MITGPDDTPYVGGQYHGTLVFPADYPFKPPAIRMMTPSGRFQNGMRLCLSISDYHPRTWNPAWSVSTILNGLLSFMVGDETTAGSITTTEGQKRQFAAHSREWNLRYNQAFCQQFPHLAEENRRIIETSKAEQRQLKAEAKSQAKAQAAPAVAAVDAPPAGAPAAAVAPVAADGKPVAATTVPAQAATNGMSTGQKVLCVVLVVVSWAVASRVFEFMR